MKVQGRPRARTRDSTFEALPTMPHAFFRTTASFEEGNMAKRQKLELELDDFSGPSHLSGPSLKANVRCVIIVHVGKWSKDAQM